MKISYCSDLHLEFQDIQIENKDGSEVLILAGDICPIIEKSIWEDFIHNISDEYCKIFIVTGNHEYYHGDIQDSLTDLLEITSNFKSVSVLNNNSEIYNEVEFWGSTLWTDFNKKNHSAMVHAMLYMNDYKYINRFSPEESTNYFYKTIEWLKESVQTQEKNIMISHHGPHIVCVDDRFYRSPMNPAYYANVPIDIIDKFDYWISGHSHTVMNYKLRDTKLLRNPRGYPKECPWFEIKTFEV